MQISTSKSDFVAALLYPYRSKLFKLNLIAFFSLVLALLLSGSAFATNYSSKTGGSWSNEDTWNPKGVPTSIDNVTISKGDVVTISEPAACKSLTIFSSGGDTRLMISGNPTLSVLNDITLESPGSGANNAMLDVGNGRLFAGNIIIKAVNGSKIARVSVLNGRIEANNISFNNVSNGRLELNGTGVLQLTGALGLGGTVSAAVSSTMIFAGQTPQTIPVSYTYGNLIGANPAGVAISGLAAIPVSIKGNLTVQSGILDNGGFAITGAALKTLRVMEGGTLALSGTSAFPSFPVLALDMASTVNYKGTVQTIAVKTYSNLAISNGGTKTLGGNLTIPGNLNLSNTKLNLNNNVLTLDAAATISGASAAGYIVPGATGKLAIKNIGSSGKGGEVLFPVGTATSYTPAYLTNLGSANTFSVNIADGVMDANNQQLTKQVVKKTWNVNKETNNGLVPVNVTMRLQWNEASDQATPFWPAYCGVRHFHNNAWDWPAFGNAVTVSGTAPNRVLSVTRSGITSFSPFTVGDGVNPLPVQLVYFKASKQGEAALLEWETASEKNNQGFEIQASADGRDFQRVGFVETRNGNSSSVQDYAYRDAQNSKAGLWYYRIKQTDTDGSVSYYGPKVIDFGRARNLVSVYPNPFTDKFEIKVQAAAAAEATITLHDLSGKLVYSGTEKLNTGINHIEVSAGDQYPASLYILTARTAGQVFVTRLLKQ